MSAADLAGIAPDGPNFAALIVPRRLSERFAQGIIWMSVAMGLAALVPAHASRLFGLRRPIWLMRIIGVRDVVIGLGLLRGRRRGLWLRLHALADIVDVVIVGAGLRSGRVAPRGAIWLVVALGSGVFAWSEARRSPVGT